MPYPINKWDQVPVYGVFMIAPGDTPVQGNVEFKLSQRVTRTDGRHIYPDGARVKVAIGNPDDQDATIRATVRSAWRAADEAAQGSGFDGSAWDVWWDTKVLPAAIFTGFPASDDPDIAQRGWTVSVEESLTGATGRKYSIQPLLSQLATPIPGINLGMVEVPPGSPTVPAPVYAKGVPGGVPLLGVDGYVYDAFGDKVGGGLPEDATLADLAESTTVKYFTSSEKSKLAGVATDATKNDTDANLKSRANHTGTQAISTVAGLQTALTAKADLVSGLIPTSQLPPLAVNETFTASSQAAMLALTAQRGDMAIRTDNGRTYVLASDAPGTLADWKEVQAAGQVVSVAGKSGTIVLDSGDLSDGSSIVKTSGNQTLSGTKTFSTAPAVPDAAFSIAKVNGLQAQLDALTGRFELHVVDTVDQVPNPLPVGHVYAVKTS